MMHGQKTSKQQDVFSKDRRLHYFHN